MQVKLSNVGTSFTNDTDSKDLKLLEAKRAGLKEDLELQWEDFHIRKEMYQFDVDVRRSQLKKAEACLTLAKRMRSEMVHAQNAIKVAQENQFKRMKDGAEASFAPVRVAETALKMSANSMELRLKNVQNDAS